MNLKKNKLLTYTEIKLNTYKGEKIFFKDMRRKPWEAG